MRQRKWRVWDKRVGRMFYPDEIKFNNTDDTVEWRFGHFGEERERVALGLLEVLPCTGIQDSNGVDIYEGDVVMIGEEGYRDREHIAEVVYYRGAYRLKPKWFPNNENPLFHFDTYYNAVFTAAPVEIIGNIHENPELKGVTDE